MLRQYNPAPHRLLADSAELISNCNGGYGAKNFSEKSCNKLIRKYRKHLPRKNSFTTNGRDILVRLFS